MSVRAERKKHTHECCARARGMHRAHGRVHAPLRACGQPLHPRVRARSPPANIRTQRSKATHQGEGTTHAGARQHDDPPPLSQHIYLRTGAGSLSIRDTLLQGLHLHHRAVRESSADTKRGMRPRREGNCTVQFGRTRFGGRGGG
jgi:hypothetical protein